MTTSFRHIASNLKNWLRRFSLEETGTATVEFVLVFPVYLFFMLSSFETGMLMIRQAMLDRGLDMAIREVRIGTYQTVTRDLLAQRICLHSGDPSAECLAATKVEMRIVDVRSTLTIPGSPDCVDRAQTTQPLSAFAEGGANQLVFVRVCSLFHPVFPTFGIGAKIPRQSGSEYALIAMSSFVKEP